MRCGKCGRTYPSKYHFVTEALCRECFEGLTEEDRDKILAEVESFSTEGSSKRTVAGHDLICPVCGHDRFKKSSLGICGCIFKRLTFFGVEWANKQADNFVCDSCGHVLWFLREAAE